MMNTALRIESVDGGWKYIVKAEDGSVMYSADTEEQCRQWVKDFIKFISPRQN